MLAVLIAVMGVGPLFTYSLSSLSPLVVERIGISAGQLGLLAAVVFGSAAISAQGLGRLADRISPKLQLILNFSGTVAALTIAATTSSFWALVAAAVLSGISQAISNPTTNRVIMEVVPPQKQATWLGIKQSGVPLSQFFAGMFFPAMAIWLGWVGATLGAVLIVIALTVYGAWILHQHYAGNTPRSQGQQTEQSPTDSEVTDSEPAGEGTALSTPVKLPHAVIILTLVAFLMGFTVQTVNVYLPLFAVEQAGFSLAQGGLTLTVCGILGMISRIWWARRVGAGARLSTLLLAMSAGAVAGVALLSWVQLGGPGALIWAAAVIHGLTALGGNVVVNAGVMKVAPPGTIGRASGVASMGMYAGFTVGPLISGLLRDISGDFLLPWAGASVSLALTAGAALWLRSQQM